MNGCRQPEGDTTVTIKPGRRELADSLLAAQGHGHPDHTIEGAFRDLLEAANRAPASTASAIIPVGFLKVLIEVYGTETVTGMVQIADTIVTVEKDKRPSLHIVK